MPTANSDTRYPMCQALWMVAALAADMSQASRRSGITPAYALKIRDSANRLRQSPRSQSGVRGA